MIQEILDYLLIKSQFLILSKEELLEKVRDEDYLEIYCDIICGIIENEYFFYTSDELMEKLQAIVYEKRFANTHSKELIVDFNIIVDAINNYKSMTDSDKMLLRAEWIKQEANTRKLPYRKFPGYLVEDIYPMIKSDSFYIENLVKEETCMDIYNPVYFLSSINLLCNKYSSIFKENPNILSLCYAFSISLQQKVCPKGYFVYSRMAKHTFNELEKIEEVISDEIKEAKIKKYGLFFKKGD